MRHLLQRLPQGCLAGLAVLALAGCSQGMSDLKQFVEKTKDRSTGQIEELPEFEPYETFTYDSTNLRDPFKPQQGFGLTPDEERELNKDSELAPDTDRPKEPLEQFPLDGLSMVGTLSQEGQLWGLVKTPENVIHRVKEGNYLGQNYGQIKDISAKKIKLSEIVPDGQGDWMKREAALGLGDD